MATYCARCRARRTSAASPHAVERVGQQRAQGAGAAAQQARAEQRGGERALPAPAASAIGAPAGRAATCQPRPLAARWRRASPAARRARRAAGRRRARSRARARRSSVAPWRDTPGTSATAWAMPSASPSAAPAFVVAAPAGPWPRASATAIATPPPVSPAAIERGPPSRRSMTARAPGRRARPAPARGRPSPAGARRACAAPPRQLARACRSPARRRRRRAARPRRTCAARRRARA